MGNVTLSSIKKTMQQRLSQTYLPADQILIVDRIVSINNNVAPTTDNATMIYMGVRKQCMEFVGSISLSSGGSYKSYGSPSVSKSIDWRPGMAIYSGKTHAMILSEIQWVNNAPTNRIVVIESNASDAKFNNPKGQIPWLRTVSKREFVKVASQYVVNLDK
jgi:hypothetical protein